MGVQCEVCMGVKCEVCMGVQWEVWVCSVRCLWCAV